MLVLDILEQHQTVKDKVHIKFGHILESLRSRAKSILNTYQTFKL